MIKIANVKVEQYGQKNGQWASGKPPELGWSGFWNRFIPVNPGVVSYANPTYYGQMNNGSWASISGSDINAMGNILPDLTGPIENNPAQIFCGTCHQNIGG